MDPAAGHDEVHVAEHADVCQGIAADGDDVGGLAGLDRADLGGKSEQVGSIDGRCLDRRHRRHAMLDHQQEFIGVASMERHPGVGAEGNPDAGRYRSAKCLAGDSDAPLNLLANLAGISVRVRAEPGDIAVHRRQGRHVISARLAEQAKTLVVDQGAVLDRIGTGPERQVDPVGAMA